MEIAKYEDVPMYRKSWFVLVSYLVFAPATVGILLTGDVYSKDKRNEGGTKKWGKANKVVGCIIGIVMVVKIIGSLMGSL